MLAALLASFLGDSLLPGRVLSPADVLLVQKSFRTAGIDVDFEPRNRLLMDPVLQFQPWLEFNRTMLRQGRLPLWNPYAGCGAPHLANGQSAVFDPFHLIAYLTDVPSALGWMAFGRLWVAGLGMFLLARAWGVGRLGRWFAGLVYPLCGFLVVWLLYPVTPVAIWLPWMLLATDRALRFPSPRAAGLVGIVVALAIAGGHIQTTAHVLIACGIYVVWKIVLIEGMHGRALPPIRCWTVGVGLGLLLGAIQIVPLWGYLAESPVWQDRRHETEPWWKLTRPRLMEAACTAIPYIYGSQRQGHPNLARRLGVNNLNEAAGGYAGLITLIWLAPLGLRSARRGPEVRFITTLTIIGAMGAFRLPPIDNLLRALPVLDVTDNRRLVLWVAFGLTLLGAFGIDAIGRGERVARRWSVAWLLGALTLAATALAIPRFEARLRKEAQRRVHATAGPVSDSQAAIQNSRLERQVRSAVSFLPRYYGGVAAELALCGALALTVGRSKRPRQALPMILLGMTVVELWLFGQGLNPAIPRDLHDREPPVIARLRARLGRHGRALGIQEELPPNLMMRFGLSDPRDYDSVELTRSLDWFASLYEPSNEATTSRRTITWDGVRRGRARLERSGVGAVVSATPPPADLFDEIEPVGDVWIGWMRPEPWATLATGVEPVVVDRRPGRVVLRVASRAPDRLLIREVWDPGWRAFIDGEPAAVEVHEKIFLTLRIPSGDHVIDLEYQPMAIMMSLLATAFGGVGVILALTGCVRF